MFPLTEEPDFVVSLGTGELKKDHASATRTPRAWKNKASPRLCRLALEKMRDQKVRQAFQFHPRYHRLDIEFDQVEPRLDDVRSIPEMKSKVQADSSSSKTVDNIARSMVASLFYFELDSIPEEIEGKSVGIGYIQCVLRKNSPAFSLLLHQLSLCSATFYLNDFAIPGRFGDTSCFGVDGNFYKRVELQVSDRFTISLKQDYSESCNISGSPYSVCRLIRSQALDAYFGTAYHRKRKRVGSEDGTSRKRKRADSEDGSSRKRTRTAWS